MASSATPIGNAIFATLPSAKAHWFPFADIAALIGGGTVTSVDITPGTGISVSGGPITTAGSITVTNTAPDQVVALTNGTGISISGTYPNFTITNSSPSSGGTVTSVATTGPITGGTITTTGTIGITKADTTTDGYLSTTDWNTFNNKQAALSGTGFVKISGTTISYDNSTYYLASNPSAYIALTALSGGTGISYNNTTGVITNSAPDQTVAISSGTGISVTGTYPSFTVTNTSPSTVTPAALTKIDDTNVTLTLGGTPATSLLQAVSLTLGWTGTLADARIASATNWNTAYTNRITSLTTTGSSGAATLISNVLNIPTYTLAGLGGISLTSLSAGTGISYNNTTGIITNSAPDQTVALTAGSNVTITGTYPNFTIAATGGGGSGTVTSVTSADGNATVATTTTTPVITIVSAPKLQTARTINGTSFDGTANITITAVPSAYTGLVESISLNDIGSAIPAQTYTLDLYAEYGYTINELKIISTSGTCSAAVQIGGTNVTGISAVSVSSTIATGTASAANTVVAGNKVTLVISSNSSLVNLQATLKLTRT